MLKNDTVVNSLLWLKNHAHLAELGNHPLGKDDWFVNIHSYETKSDNHCVWESHKQTVDIQFMIEGVEMIQWLPDLFLGEPIKVYDDVDRIDWSTSISPVSSIILRSGMFVIFLPGEAHCPMIAVDKSIRVHKAVVKIPITLLDEGY